MSVGPDGGAVQDCGPAGGGDPRGMLTSLVHGAGPSRSGRRPGSRRLGSGCRRSPRRPARRRWRSSRPTGMGQGAGLQVGDDLLDAGVVTVLGVGGQQRGPRVRDYRVVVVRRETARPARRVRRPGQSFDAAHDQAGLTRCLRPADLTRCTCSRRPARWRSTVAALRRRSRSDPRSRSTPCWELSPSPW